MVSSKGHKNSRFELEVLEPRVLLSADVLLVSAVAANAVAHKPVEAAHQESFTGQGVFHDSLHYNPAGETGGIFDGVSGSAVHSHVVAPAQVETHNGDQNAAAVEPAAVQNSTPVAQPKAQVQAQAKVAVSNVVTSTATTSSSSISAKATASSSTTTTQQLTASLTAANGPPASASASQVVKNQSVSSNSSASSNLKSGSNSPTPNTPSTDLYTQILSDIGAISGGGSNASVTFTGTLDGIVTLTSVTLSFTVTGGNSTNNTGGTVTSVTISSTSPSALSISVGGLTASVGSFTGTYTVSTKQFSLTLSSVSIALSSFVNIGASSVSLTYTGNKTQSVNLTNSTIISNGSTETTDTVSLLTLGITGAYVFAGLNGPTGTSWTSSTLPAGAEGLSITGVNLALAVFSSTSSSGAIYYGLSTTGGTVALVGLPNGFTTSVSDLSVSVNSGNSAAAGNVVDFDSTFVVGTGLTISTGGTPASIALDFNQPLIQASGTVTLDFNGFVYVNGGMSFQTGTTSAVNLVDASGNSAGTDSVSVLEVLASDVTIFAGINGPTVGADWQLPANAAGVLINGGSFALALLTNSSGVQYYGLQAGAGSATTPDLVPTTATYDSSTGDYVLSGLTAGAGYIYNQAAPVDPATTSIDTSLQVDSSTTLTTSGSFQATQTSVTLIGTPGDAVTATVTAAAGVSLVGLPTGITITAGYVSVAINGSTGSNYVDFDTSFTSPITPTPTSGPTTTGGLTIQGANSSAYLDFTGKSLSVAGSLTLDFNGFIYITGNISFQQGGTLPTSVTLSDSTTATPTSILEVGASGVTIFAGLNGPATNSNAVGVELDNAGFALAIITATQNSVSSTYYGLQATADSLSAVGLPSGFNLSATNLGVEINGGNNSTGAVMNFGSSFGTMMNPGLSVSTGGGNSTTLDFTGKMIQVYGGISLQFSSYISISGGFSYTQSSGIVNLVIGSGAYTGASDLVFTLGSGSSTFFKATGSLNMTITPGTATTDSTTEINSASLTINSGFNISGILSVGSPSVSITDITIDNTTGNIVTSGNSTLTIQAATATLFPSSGVSASITATLGTVGTAPGDVDGLGLNGTFNLSSGAFSLTLEVFTLTVTNAFSAVATGVVITYSPNGGSNQQLVNIASLTATFNGLSGNSSITGTITNLFIYGNGFSFASTKLSYNGTVTIGSVLNLVNPSVTISNFSVTVVNGVTTFSTPTLAVAVDSATLTVGSFTGMATGLVITVNLADGSTSIVAGSLSFAFGSYISISGTSISINTDPGQGNDYLTVGTATVTLSAGSFSVTGTASNFSIEDDNGTPEFEAGSNFTISLSTPSSLSSLLPSWIGFTISQFEISWPDFGSDPTNFSITLSASISSISGLPGGVTVSGGITDAVIDPGLLAKGEFPITSIGSVSGSVSGTLFGMQVSATFVIGIVNFNAAYGVVNSDGSVLNADGTTTAAGSATSAQTTVTGSTIYVGVQGSAAIPDLGTVSISFGFSSLGPLSIYLSWSAPVGNPEAQLILDPETGIAISGFSGGVAFNQTMLTPTSATDLPGVLSDALLKVTGSTTGSPTSVNLAQWQQQLELATVAQYTATSGGTNLAAEYSQPFLILASVTMDDAYLSPDALQIVGTMVLGINPGATAGQAPVTILISGSVNLGGSSGLSGASGYLYGSFTDSGASLMFLVNIPSQLEEFGGGLTFSFTQDGNAWNHSDSGSPNGFTLSLSGFFAYSIADPSNTADSLASLSINGTVTVTETPSQLTIDLSGDVNVSFLGDLGDAVGEIVFLYNGSTYAGTSGADATAGFTNNSGSTEIFGALDLYTGSAFNKLAAYGLNVDGAALFQINTTGQNVVVNLPPPPSASAGTPATPFIIQGSVLFDLTITGTTSTYATISYEVNGDTLFQMQGFFDVRLTDINGSLGFQMFADINTLTLGPPGASFLSFSGFGLFIVNSSGLAAEISLNLNAGFDGITFTANFDLVLNTTSQAVSFTIPTVTIPTSTSGATATAGINIYNFDSNGNSTLAGTVTSLIIPAGLPEGPQEIETINGVATGTFGTAVGATGPYILVTGVGSLKIYNYSFTGFFYFQVSDSSAGPVVALYLNVMGDLGFGSVNVTGGFQLSSSGVVALLEASGNAGTSNSYGAGITLALTAELAINTTDAAVTSIGGVNLTDTSGNPLTIAARSAEVVASGTLTMTFGPGSLVINGLFSTSTVVTGSGATEVDTTTITANGTLTASVGGTTLLTMNASGVLVFTIAGVNNSSTAGFGMAGELTLTAGSSNPLSGSGFSFNGTFDMEVNTTGVTQNVMVGNSTVSISAGPDGADTGGPYAEVHANGLMLFGTNSGTANAPNYNGFVLNGDFYLVIGSDGLDVSASANLGVYVGGTSLLNVSASGAMLISSSGFAASISVMTSLNDPSGLYGFSGQFNFQANTTGVTQTIGTVTIPAGPVSDSSVGAPYFQLYISGTLALGSTDTTVTSTSSGLFLSGDFYLSISTAGLTVVANATLTADVLGTPLLTMTASGALIITSAGIAGELTLTVNVGGDPLNNDGGVFSFTGSYNLQVNTTGVNYYIGSNGTISTTNPVPVAGVTIITISAGPDGNLTSPSAYFEVEASGTLIFGTSQDGFSLSGNLFLTIGTAGLAISANVGFTANVLGTSLLTMNASGALIITSAGLAGELTLTFAAGATNPLNGLGFSFNGTFSLALNTTGINYYVESDGSISTAIPTSSTYITISAGPDGDMDTPGSSYFEIDAYGSLVFGTPSYGFSLTGDLFLSIGTAGLAVSTNDTFTVNLGSSTTPIISLTASGAMEITSAGLAASLTLTASSGNSLFTNESGFGFNGTFTFQLNTTNKAINDMVGNTQLQLVAGPYFQLYVGGTLALGAAGNTGLFLNGSFNLTISTSGLAIAANASLSAEINGTSLLTLNAVGGLILTSSGLAGAITLTTGGSSSVNPLNGSGFNFSGSFSLQVNTTGTTYYIWSNSTISTAMPTLAGVTTTTTISAGPGGSATASSYFQIYAQGTIFFGTSANGVITNGFSLGGSFYLAVGTNGLIISTNVKFAAAVLGTPLLNVSASGAMEITSAGLAASFTLTVGSGGLGMGSTFNFSGTFGFQINTTNQAITSIGTVTVNLLAGPYFQLSITGATLTFGGGGSNFGLTDGSFVLSISSSGLAVSAAATLDLAGLATFSASGGLLITAGGLAAQLKLTLGSGGFASNGFSFTATFLLEINTTSSAITSINNMPVSIPSGPFFEVAASGTLVLAGIVDVNGSFIFSVGTSGLLISISAAVNVFGISFTVNGFASISSAGIALDIQLSVGSNSSPTVTLIPGVLALSGSFTLIVNTTGQSSFTVNGTTYNFGDTAFEVSVSASINIFGFTLAQTSLTIKVTNAGVFSASGTTSFNFFGFATISVGFYFDSSGTYWFYGQLYAQLGSGSFNIHGTLTLEFASNSAINNASIDNGYPITANFLVSISGGLTAFGFNIASVYATLSISGTHVYFSVGFSIHIWFIHIHFTVTISLGSISPVAAPPPPPTGYILTAPTVIDGQTFAAGTLLLNVGQYANTYRAVAPLPDENYAVTYIGAGSVTGTEDIEVSAVGVNGATAATPVYQYYDNVTGIVMPDADIGNSTSNVTLTVNGAVNVPVTVFAGSGTNVFTFYNTNSATVTGTDGTDTVNAGSGNTIFNAGSGTNIFNGGSGTATVTGSSGDDTVIGGTGNVTFNVGSGSSTFAGGGTGTTKNTITDPGNVLVIESGYSSYSLVGTAGNITTGTLTYGGNTDTLNNTSGDISVSLTGVASGAQTFSVKNYSGTVTLDANGNTSATTTIEVDSGNLTVNNAGGNVNTITESALAGSTGPTGTITLQSAGGSDVYGTLTLDGGSGVNVFTINSWTGGAVTMDGMGGGDTYIVNFQSSGSFTAHIDDTGTTGNDLLTVNAASAGNPLYVSGTQVSVGTQIATYSGVENLVVNTAANNQSVVVTSTSATTAINTGNFTDTVNVGSNATATSDAGGTLSTIVNSLTISGTSSQDTLNLDDSADTTAGTGILTASSLNGFFGSGGSLTYSDIKNLNLSLGSGTDTLYITSTSSATNINTSRGTNTVDIGSTEPTPGGILKNIQGVLTIAGNVSTPATTVYVDDTGDTMATGVLTATTLKGFNMVSGGIVYSGLSALNISLGGTKNTFTINNTSATTNTTLYGSSGIDTVTVNDDSGTTSIYGNGGGDTINLVNDGGTTLINESAGSNTINIKGTGTGTVTTVDTSSDSTGSNVINFGSVAPAINGVVSNIQGAVYLTGNGKDTANVGDTADNKARTGQLTSTTLTGLGMGAGITYSGVKTLVISLGSGGNTFNVLSTYSATVTTLNTGTGTNTVTVASNAPANNSSSILTGIAGQLTVTGQGKDTMNVNDTGDANSGILTQTATTLTGLGMGANGIIYSSIETLNINLGANNNTIYIQGNPAVTTENLNTGTGTNTISLGSAAQAAIVTNATTGDATNTGSVLTNVQGIINVTGSGTDTMNVDDSGATAGEAGGLWGNKLQFLDPVTINFTGIAAINISLSQGADYFVVAGTITNSTATPVVVVDGNGGNDTFVVLSTSAVMTLNGGDGNDAFYDYGNASTLNLNGNGGNDTFYIYGSVAAGTGNYNVNGPVNVNGGLNSSTTGTPDINTLFVYGTVLDDVITIIGPNVSGAGLDVNFSNIQQLNVAGLAGDDTFNIESIIVSTTVLGDGTTAIPSATVLSYLSQLKLSLPDLTGGSPAATSFDDTFYVGWQGASYIPSINGSLSGIIAPLTIDGDNGPGYGNTPNTDDTIYADDSVDLASRTFTLTATTLTSSSMGVNGLINYDPAVENLNIFTSQGTNTITVNGNGTAAQTTIYGGRGNDSFIVNAAIPLLAPLALLGGGNTFVGDSLTVNGATAGNTFNITGYTIDGDGATISYEEMEKLTINAGGATTFNVIGDSIPTYLNGGTGNDTFTVNSNTTSLYLNGGTGNETFVINGNSGALTATATVGTNSFTVNGNGSNLLLNGGSGADSFVINANSGTLTANGNGGNDTFVVNAISSAATLNGNAGNDTFTVNAPLAAILTVNGGGDASDLLIVNGTIGNDYFTITNNAVNGVGSAILYNTVSYLTVNGVAGNDTFLVLSDNAATTTTLNGSTGNDLFYLRTTSGPTIVNTGGGINIVDIGANEPYTTGNILDGIQGPVTVNGDAQDVLNIDDSASTSNKNGTLTATTLTGLAMGAGGITYYGIPLFNLKLGSGSDTLNVQSTNATTVYNVNMGAGTNIVNIGSLTPTLIGGIVDGVQGTLNLTGSGNDTLNVDDTGSTIAKTGAMTSSTITGLGMGVGGVTYVGFTTLNISLGSGGNTFTIYSTLATTVTTLNSGSGSDTVNLLTDSDTTNINGQAGNDTINIQSTGATTNVNTGSGTNTVNVGSLAPGVGGIVNNIQGTLNITGSGSDILNVDDTGSTAAKTGVLTSSTLTGLGMGVGGITYTGLAILNINLGSGSDTFNIQSTYISTVNNLNTGAGTNTVNIGSLAPAVGGILNNIQGTVNVTGSGTDTLNVDDTGSTAAKTGVLTSSTLNGLGMGSGGINYTGLATLNISLGSGGNTFTIDSTYSATVTTLNSGSGNDTVNVLSDAGVTNINGQAGNDTINIQTTGATTNVNTGAGTNTVNIGSLAPALTGGIVDGIQGTVNVTGSGTDTMNVDDTGSTTAKTGAMTSSTINGLGMGSGGITYTGLATLNISLGSGGNTFTIDSTYSATVTTLNSGSGSDTVNLLADSDTTNINGQVGNDTINIQTTGATTNVNTGSGTNTVNIGSLAPLVGGIVDGVQGTVNVTGSGADIMNVDDTGSTAAKTGVLTSSTLNGLGMGSGGINYTGLATLNISLGSGGNTFTIDSTFVTTVTTLNSGSGNDTVNLLTDSDTTNINGQAGNDTINIQTTGATTNVNTGNGTNTVNIGSLTPLVGGIVDGIQGTVNVTGSGTDTMNVDDTGSTAAKTGVLTSSTLNGLGMGSGGINYTGLATLNISLGSGGNTFTIDSTFVTTVTTLNSGSGNDTVNLLTDSGVTNINGQAGNDTINIQTTGATTNVNTGSGTNTVNVGSLAPAVGGKVNGIQGTVNVTGSGSDILNVDDTGSTASKTGAMTSSTITGLGMGVGGITYTGLATLNLKLGSGSDTFNVQSTYISTVNNLNTGGGTNTVNVGSLAPAVGGIVDGVQGTLNVTGSGNDTMNVDDTGSTATKTGAMTSSTITGLGMGSGGITYTGLSNLNISLGSGGNTFTINSTLATAVTRLNSGAGNDTVNLLTDSGITNINGQAGNDTINIQSTGATTNVNTGAGTNTVNIGSLAPAVGGILNNIQGTVNVSGSGSDILNVDDTGSTAAKTGTLTANTLTGLGMGAGGITYTGLAALNISLGSGGNTFTISSTSTNAATVTTLNSGSGNDTVNLLADYSTTNINTQAGNDVVNVQTTGAITNVNTGSGTNTVNVGSLAPAVGGNVNGIQGTLNVTGSGTDTMNVDDTGSTAAKTGAMTSSTITGLGMGAGGITYTGLAALNITLGSGGNNFTIGGTSSATTRVNSGNGNDTFNLQATTGTLYVNGDGGSNTFNLGSLAPVSGGTLNKLTGAIFITGGNNALRLINLSSAGTNIVNLDDSGDSTNNTGTLTSSTLTGLGMGGVTFVAVNVMNLKLGSGSDTFNVQSTNASTVTNLNTGAGADVVNVGSLAPVIGSTVNGIQGTLNVTGSGNDTLNVDDTGSTAAKTGTLTSSTLTGLGLGAGGITYTGLAALNISLGSGGNTFTINSTKSTTVTTLNSGSGNDVVNLLTDSGVTNINGQAGNDTINIQSTGATTNVNTGAGTNTVNIGSLAPNVGGIINNIQGTVNVTGSGSDILNVDDTGSTIAKTGTLTSSALTGLGAGGITYTGLAMLNINLGSGSDTFNVQSTSSGTVTNLNTGAGIDIVNVGSLAPNTGGIVNNIQGILNVIGSGNDTLNVDDTGSMAAKSGTLTATTLTGLGMGSGGITYSGLITLNINLGSGSDTFTITGITNTTVTTVNGDGGTNTAIMNFSGNFAGNLTLLNFVTASLYVGGNFSGTLTDAGAVTPVTIVGSLTSTGILNAGSIATMTVGVDLAGLLNVTGLLGTLTITGGSPGKIVVGSVNVINVLAGYGNKVLQVITAGIERDITATPVAGGTMPNTVHFMIVYDAQTASDPQAAIRVTDTSGTVRSYNLALVVVNSSTAKFDLSRLDSTGATGIGNISVQGDLLTKLTTPELAVFTNLTGSSSGGIVLPTDNIIGVEVSGKLPEGFINVAGIEGLAFGALTTANGAAVTVTNLLGTTGGLQAFWAVLGSHAALNSATDVLVVPFVVAEPVSVFAHIDSNTDMALVMTLSDQNTSNLPLTAYVQLVPLSGNNSAVAVQSLTYTASGGSVTSPYLIRNTTTL